MHVQAAVGRDVQHRWRQDEAIGGDDDDVGGQRGQGGHRLRLTQRGRLQHRNAVPCGQAFDGRSGQLATAAGRAVGLRRHTDHLVAAGQQRGQRRHGEVRRAHEDNACGHVGTSRHET